MKRVLLSTCAALTLIFGVSTANAEPIKTWDYSVTGMFFEWTNAPTNLLRTTYTTTVIGEDQVQTKASNSNNPVSGYHSGQSVKGATSQRVDYDYYGGVAGGGTKYGYRTMTWGDGKNYSSIGLNPKSGQVFTDATYGPDTANGAELWHENQSISSTIKTLTYGKALMGLELTGLAADNSVAFATTKFATELEFYFIETSNSSSHPSDIFIVKAPFDVATEKFTDDEENEYYFSFAGSFQALSGEALRLAQNASGWSGQLYGWVTEENATTTIPTTLTIHYKTAPPVPVDPTNPTPTPEPASLLLMGIGLAGMKVMARRRKEKVDC